VSLTNLAPAKKSEQLIYSILPVSLGVWVASWIGFPDITQNLTILVSISSFGIIILYETTPEEWFVNWFLRKRTMARDSLQIAFLIIGTFLQMWRGEPSEYDPNKEDYFVAQERLQVNISIRSPYAQRKIWRIRGSLFVILAQFFVINALWNYLKRLSIDINALWNYQVFVDIGAIIPIFFIDMITILIAMLLVRNRKLTSHLDHLARLYYLRELMSIKKLRYPQLFSGADNSKDSSRVVDNFAILDTEMQILTNLLNTDDWEGFLHRWDRIYHWIHYATRKHIETKGAYDLIRPFTETFAKIPKDSTSSILQEQFDDRDKTSEVYFRELGWVRVFYNKYIEFKDKSNDPPMPQMESDLVKIIDWVNKVSINALYSRIALLTLVSTMNSIKFDSPGAIALWPFAKFTPSSAPAEYSAEPVLKYLIEEVDKSKPTISHDLLSRVILKAYDSGGLGFRFTLIDRYESLKSLQEHLPDGMEQQLHNAIIQFILQHKDEAKLVPLLQDTSFIKPLMANGPIHEALVKLKGKIANKNILNALRKLGI
jgi:hypothetical protein